MRCALPSFSRLSSIDALFRSVLAQSLQLALGGLLAGLGLAILSTHYLRSLLFGVQPTDLLTFVTVCSAICAVAILAAVIPAQRAISVDPAAALRHD